MNIVRLNTLADGRVIVKGSGGGSSKGGMKYYDCLFDEEEHATWNLANVKIVDFKSGDAYIGPDGWNGEDTPENAEYYMVAVAVPQGRRYYANGKWLDEKEMYANTSSFNPDAHIEITEEEFYHIPDDVVWDCNTEEGCKEAFGALWVLCKRYEGKFDESNPLPLIFWHKSIDLVTYSSVDSLYGFSDNGEQQDIYLTQVGEYGPLLRKVGESYTFSMGESLVFDAESYEDRKALYEYLYPIAQGSNQGGVELTGYVTLINYMSGRGTGPVHLIKGVEEVSNAVVTIWDDNGYIANLTGPNGDPNWEHGAYTLYYED